MNSKNPKQNIQFNTNKHIPENKNDIDSRKKVEQIQKGENITHNSKEGKTQRKKKSK